MARWKEAGNGWECRPDGHWLETERLLLRPLILDDAEAPYGVFDEEVVHWQGYPSDPTELRKKADSWCERAHQHAPGHPTYLWAICDRTTGELVGDRIVTAHTRGSLRGRASETGSNLKDGWRDKGCGTEELWAVIQLVTEHLGYSVMFASTDPDNERALRLYEKCGFEPYRTKRLVLPNGRVIDALVLRRRERAAGTCRHAFGAHWYQR